MVPISLEALIVNSDGNGQKFAHVTPNFDLLRYGQVLGDDMAGDLFQTTATPEPGLHLHWALPDALTRGAQTAAVDFSSFHDYLAGIYKGVSRETSDAILKQVKDNRFLDNDNRITRRFTPGQTTPANPPEDQTFSFGLSDALCPYESSVISYFRTAVAAGEVDYPAAPDHWHILRILTEYGGNNTPPQVSMRAWIVESRHAVKDHNQGKGRVTIPAFDSTDDTFYPLYLGRKSNYEDWTPDSPDQYIDKITAVGPGDPMFAAYYPNSRTVFGFHDPFTDAQGRAEKKGVYTYMITGWYADTGQDPLTGNVSSQLWNAWMETLGWSAPDTGSAPPESTLCHGMIYNIGWNGQAFDYGTDMPESSPEITWGQTSVEALATLIASKLPAEQRDAAKVLEALNYEQLSRFDFPDGIQKLEETIHEKGFTPTSGGVTWVISYPGNEDSPPDTTRPFPGDMGSSLNRLNTLTLEKETLARNISSLRWEAYSAWYRYVSDRDSPMPDVDIDLCGKIIDKIGATVAADAAQVEKLTQEIAALGQTIEAQIAATPSLKGYRLETVNRNDFWQPNDPVLLFSGDGVSRSFRHGYDTAFSDSGRLNCRVSGTTLDGVALTAGSTPVTVTAEDLLSFVTAFPKGKTTIPEDIRALAAETLLLDPGQSRLIAWAAFGNAGVKAPDQGEVAALAKKVETLQTMIWNACQIKGVTPAQVASAGGFSGTAPEKISVKRWTQAWVPLFMEWQANMLKDEHLAPDFSNLISNWQLGDIDYTYSGKAPGRTAVQIQGSVLITPHAQHNLKTALQNYIDKLPPQDPMVAELKEIRDELETLDILSQSMSGFNTALISQKQTLQFPVFDIPQGRGYKALAAKVAGIVGHQNNLSPMPSADFNPVRAGFLRLLQLWIVDAFGQVKTLDGFKTNLVSEEMSTPGVGFEHWVTLKPRVSQPVRLNLDWLSPDNKQISGSDPASSPVCGWVLPNHLDQSLMIYDREGAPQGEIRRFARPEMPDDIQWVSAPNTRIGIADLPSPQLKGFVDQLFKLGKNRGAAFKELMDTIDETLWSIDPLGFRQNQSISVLIGRPLALLNAGVGMEFLGCPACSQTYSDLMAYPEKGFNTRGFEKGYWPVRMGDISQICDGLLGYFVQDGQGDYRIFHTPHGASQPKQPSGYVSYDHTLKLNLETARQQVHVTLLMDPRAELHLTSGILPVSVAQLPPDYVSGTLDTLSVTFGITPLVNPPERVCLPLPSVDASFFWSWIERSGIEEWQEISKITDDNAKPAFPDQRCIIKEGWLKLTHKADAGTPPS